MSEHGRSASLILAGATFLNIINSHSGLIKVLVNTCYKCFHAHTKHLNMRKWVFEIMFQIWVKTASA